MLHDKQSNEAYVGIIIQQIKDIRKLQTKIDKQTQKLFENINFFVGDVSQIPIEFGNANNLEELIQCFINYNESNLSYIKDQLLKAIPKD